MNPKITNLLSLFQLKEAEQQLFEDVLAGGFITASELARQANITRTSVYDYLERLKDKGLVVQTLKNGVRVYNAEQPEKINLLLQEQEKVLFLAKQSLEELKNEYNKSQINLRPRLQMFEGKAALQQMMKDLLLYPDITMRVYWPILDVIKHLGVQFVADFNKARLKERISLKTVWPRSQVPSLSKYPFLKIGEADKREVRLAPEGVDFSLGYAIYGNTVRFISSSKESFGFLITSKEFAETMKGNFDIIWGSSTPFKL